MGIHHLEFWVTNWERARPFYDGLFRLTGWKKCAENAYFSGQTEIYFVERKEAGTGNVIGPRHICLRAENREMVEAVHAWLASQEAEIIRGPVEMPGYSPGYYTVDFRDKEGYIWEVAYTPHLVWTEQEATE
jgi:catechol 2,3-dioxygenase-like lactoylglutathione lyase family enzyme